MKFVIERGGHKVGVSSCRDCMDGQPYISVAKTVEEMLTLIGRVDIKDGHSAPSSIYACSTCIGY